MSATPEREAHIFSAARKLPAAERAFYLDGACAGDAPLRRRVEELLQVNDAAGAFLPELTTAAEGSAPSAAAREAAATIRVAPSPSEQPGDSIDRYKLLEKIGEGGFGVVYVAEQKEPVKRRVALKIIKLGMDTKQVVARFGAERQALALMDHPNIAKVLDAGTTQTGRPFFVMELVKGIKLTDYCDKNKLSTKERLDLFIQVCRAIQHAHQKGIIHRDIKPSNILVTLHDGVPVPKVIDFGIAKATQGDLTDQTVYTQYQQFIGTPAYMSPEQAEMSGLDIDTRSDIYSLGVLLYELLTGKTPFDPKELMASGIDAMRKTIREKEPVRPSTRLATLQGEDLTTAASQRSSDTSKLMHQLKGDLDWIVMKALEKDRTRRYETANGLMVDIQRHLKNEPVVARPPSNLYRFQKMVRRNKLAYVAGFAVVAALLIGTAASTWQARVAIRAQREAEKSRVAEKEQRLAAQQERDKATSARAEVQQNLYDSLLGQARATRLARRMGYRDQVFPLLQKARTLDVPQKNLAELRNEAVACLGDYMGLAPKVLTNPPDGASIQHMLLDPSGRFAALFMTDHSILMRDLSSGEVVGRLPGARGACFNAAGDEFIEVIHPKATVEEYGEAPVPADFAGAWIHVRSRGPGGQWVESHSLPWPGAYDCDASLEGVVVVSADFASHSIQVFDLRTKTLKLEFPYRPDMRYLPGNWLSPDGRWFAARIRAQLDEDPAHARGFHPRVDIWDLSAGNHAPASKSFFLSQVPMGLNFSPDGKHLAIRELSGIAIYSTNGFERIAGHPEVSDDFSFAPRGTVMALLDSQQHRVRFWDWTRNEEVIVMEETQTVDALHFALDGRSLLTRLDGAARLYQLDGTVERLNLPGRHANVQSVVFSPDGSRVAFAAGDRTLTAADAATGREVWSVDQLPAEGCSVAYGADGRLLVTAYRDNAALWLSDAQNGRRLLELGTNLASGLIWADATFGPDGHYLALSSADRIRIWTINLPASGRLEDGITARLMKEFHRGWCRSPAFAPDGRHLVFVDRTPDGRTYGLYSLDLATAEEPQLVGKGIKSLAFGWDGSHLVFADETRAIVTLDSETGNILASFPTFPPTRPKTETRIECLSLSPDGTRLALSSRFDRGVDIWDPHRGSLLYSLPDQNDAVRCLAWSPDSQRLAVSRANGDISIWSLKEVEAVLAKLNLSP